jgi:hypothetical protein
VEHTERIKKCPKDVNNDPRYESNAERMIEKDGQMNLTLKQDGMGNNKDDN